MWSSPRIDYGHANVDGPGFGQWDSLVSGGHGVLQESPASCRENAASSTVTEYLVGLVLRKNR